MPRKKKQWGRPARGLPPRIDATGEEIAQVLMRTRPPGPPVDLEKVYRCVSCEREVNYPDILYRDGRCGKCHPAPDGCSDAGPWVIKYMIPFI